MHFCEKEKKIFCNKFIFAAHKKNDWGYLINDFSSHHLIRKFYLGQNDPKVFCLRKISEIFLTLAFVTLKNNFI